MRKVFAVALLFAPYLIACAPTVYFGYNRDINNTPSIPTTREEVREAQERRLTPAGKDYYFGPGGIPLAGVK